MGNIVPSLIRTYVPVGVGLLAAWLVTQGVELEAGVAEALALGLGGVLIAVYYTLVRVLEQRVPWLGGLLGYAKSPDSYSPGEAGYLDPESLVKGEPEQTDNTGPVDDDIADLSDSDE